MSVLTQKGRSHGSRERPRETIGGVLDLERTAAAAGGLHLGIVEFESLAFQRLDVIYFGAIEIEEAGLVHENLQLAIVVGLIQHIRRILEGHGVAEPGTAAAHH